MSLGDAKRNTVILPPDRAWAPWPSIPAGIGHQMAPGAVMFVMDQPPAQSAGMILLADETQGHLMINTATVVAVGPDRPERRGSCPPVKMELSAGERVLCLPFEGLRYRFLSFPGWAGEDVRLVGGVTGNLPINPENRMRIFSKGLTYDFEPYHMALPCTIMENKIGRMLGDWIIIRRDPPKDEKSGILLMDKSRGDNSLGDWKATVVHASARAIENGYSPGKRVIYHAPSTQVFLDGCHGTAGLEGDLADYAIIRWTQCLNCWVDESHEYARKVGDEFTNCYEHLSGSTKIAIAAGGGGPL